MEVTQNYSFNRYWVTLLVSANELQAKLMSFFPQ